MFGNDNKPFEVCEEYRGVLQYYHFLNKSREEYSWKEVQSNNAQAEILISEPGSNTQ